MSYIRRNMRFWDIWSKESITGALVIGAIIILFGLFFGVTVFSDVRNEKIREQNIYFALGEKKVDDERAVKTASMVKILYASDANGFKNILDGLDSRGSYVATAAKYSDNLELILSGAPEAENIKVKIPLWSWWWKVVGITSWLIVGIAISIGYLFLNEDDGEWWQYPWNKFWAYPMVLIMPCYVIFVQSGTAIYFLVRQIKGEDAQEKKNKEERQKISFDNDVFTARSGLESSRRAWIDLGVNGLKEEEKLLERELRDWRASLVDLGQKIENAQRNLAETQTKLMETSKIVKTVHAKTREDISREFDELLRQPGLRAVKVGSGKIELYTETVFIDYLGKTYELGDYLIKISTWPKRYIAVKNLRNTSTCGSDHPFSRDYSWTNFCFGLNAEAIEKNLKEKNFYPLIVFILQAIGSNKGDYSVDRIRKWRVREGGEK